MLKTLLLTGAQRTALEYPCYLAIESLSPLMRHVTTYGSLVLSVNRGYE